MANDSIKQLGSLLNKSKGDIKAPQAKGHGIKATPMQMPKGGGSGAGSGLGKAISSAVSKGIQGAMMRRAEATRAQEVAQMNAAQAQFQQMGGMGTGQFGGVSMPGGGGPATVGAQRGPMPAPQGAPQGPETFPIPAHPLANQMKAHAANAVSLPQVGLDMNAQMDAQYPQPPAPFAGNPEAAMALNQGFTQMTPKTIMPQSGMMGGDVQIPSNPAGQSLGAAAAGVPMAAPAPAAAPPPQAPIIDPMTGQPLPPTVPFPGWGPWMGQ